MIPLSVCSWKAITVLLIISILSNVSESSMSGPTDHFPCDLYAWETKSVNVNKFIFPSDDAFSGGSLPDSLKNCNFSDLHM
jgi:hypothetical protein